MNSSSHEESCPTFKKTLRDLDFSRTETCRAPVYFLKLHLVLERWDGAQPTLAWRLRTVGSEGGLTRTFTRKKHRNPEKENLYKAVYVANEDE